jgi:hypothetical protein
MTEMTKADTKQLNATQLEPPKLKAVNYANMMSKLVVAMKDKGISCHIERRKGGGINVAVFGVTIGEDGKFVVVKDEN